jgi:hypothetical protein
MSADPAKGKLVALVSTFAATAVAAFPAVATSAPPGVRGDATVKEPNGYTFCRPDPGKLPGSAAARPAQMVLVLGDSRADPPSVLAWGDDPPDPPAGGTHGVGGSRVTPVNSRADLRVILSQRILCAGRGDHSANEDIRCAPDLILAQRERMDG